MDFPLGVFTAVTGVSGSGKSTLVNQVLGDVVMRQLGSARGAVELGDPDADSDDSDAEIVDLDHDASIGVTADGLEAINRLVRVDQKPIGRTPRSNLATYTGLFDAVRKVFAATRRGQARAATTPGRFSFNVAERPLPDLPGRGLRVRRAAVPARHLRALPDLPRRPLQREDARGALPRADHRRRARR